MSKWPDILCLLHDTPLPVGKQLKRAFDHVKTEHKLTYDGETHRWEDKDGIHYNEDQVLRRDKQRKKQQREAATESTTPTSSSRSTIAKLVHDYKTAKSALEVALKDMGIPDDVIAEL